MEVAVITRHAIANYGSLLQAAATQNAIEALGHSCRIIDYVRPNEVCTQLHKCQLQQKPRWNRTPLRRRVYSTLRYTENVMAGRLFESARRQMLHLTEPFSTAQELTANGPKADVYMTGSDQVWGPMEDGTYDPVYRLAFAPEGAKKVAYAASFGRTELSKPLRGQFCRDLRQYTSITVREDSAIALLRQLGLEGKQVIDPVFLPDDDFWQSLLEPISAAPDSYFLVYQIHKDPALCAYAKAAAKAVGKPLLRLSASVHQATWGGKFIYAPTPGPVPALYQKCRLCDHRQLSRHRLFSTLWGALCGGAADQLYRHTQSKFAYPDRAAKPPGHGPGRHDPHRHAHQLRPGAQNN